MNIDEVISELENIKSVYKHSLTLSSQRKRVALDKAITALQSACSTCKHEDVEPWDSPCYDCSHNHKDYYIAK